MAIPAGMFKSNFCFETRMWLKWMRAYKALEDTKFGVLAICD